MKTRNLIGPALDWAVAKCEGKSPSLFIYKQTGALAKEHDYSTDWSLGGPIIEREAIELAVYGNQWRAVMYIMQESIYQEGSTPLIAAMRCYVSSKLGDEAEIPEELL